MNPYTVIRRKDFETNDATLAAWNRYFDGPYGAYMEFGGIQRPTGYVEIP